MIFNGVIDADNCHNLVSNDLRYISIPLELSGVHTDILTFFFLEMGSTRHRAFTDTVQQNLRKGKKYIHARHR